MIPSSSSSKILIGIPLDPDESNELLLWAIRVLATPNDTIVAVHVVVEEEESKKKKNKKKKKVCKRVQSRIRQGKAHVISVLGEHAWTCQSKQINLEARVGFSSSIQAGLVHECKSISADYLVLPGLRSKSNRTWHEVIKFCFEHAPEGCSVISIGKSQRPQVHQSNSEWLRKGKDDSIEDQEHEEDEHLTRRQNGSPRTVLDELEEEGEGESSCTSTTEDEITSISDSTVTGTESPISKLIHHQSKSKRHMSPYKFISSFLTSPLRKRTYSFSGKPKQQQQLQQHHQSQQQALLKCFTYEEIARATNDFDPGYIVGRGGYSEVYRGDLSDGRTIAVKRLAKDNKDANKEKEFLTELGILGHVCHPNTATLVGCCIENGLYLVFSFSQNGNLSSALHGESDNEVLDWETRYRIVLGVARGLHYLHKCCKRRIIHRDIKASNVLLGPDYEPQITDFGLAKWLPNKWTHHAVIPIEGTFGYLAPEYFMHGIVDEKTDVFAFGVLLLEIISGRRPVDSSMQNLLLWAKPLMESGNVAELADLKLEGRFDTEQMHRFVLTASYCVRQSAAWRPSMSEVLELLTTTGGQDSEASTTSSRIPKFTSDELDDFSMVYGYDFPIDIDLEEYL
ncbi:Probable receptor-like serine/threonine-protein kinase At5g57670 [Linum perenne]